MAHPLFLAILVAVPSLAFAIDQTILGRQLLVKNPSTPEKRSIVTSAKESASMNTVVGDPAALGGQLSITVNGTSTATVQNFPLPGGASPLTGKPFWSGDATKGFKYKDAKGENGAVKALQIRKSAGGTFQVKAVLSARSHGIDVVPPDPGTGGCILLGLGGGDSYSIRFADGAITNRGSTLFKVSAPTSEGTCFFPTSVSTTTTTTSSTTSTTVTPVCGNGVLEEGEDCDGGPYCTVDCDTAPPNCCAPTDDVCRTAPSFVLNGSLFLFCAGDPPIAGGVCGGDGTCSVQPIPSTAVCCQTGSSCSDATVDDTAELWFFRNSCVGASSGQVRYPATCVAGTCTPQ